MASGESNQGTESDYVVLDAAGRPLSTTPRLFMSPPNAVDDVFNASSDTTSRTNDSGNGIVGGASRPISVPIEASNGMHRPRSRHDDYEEEEEDEPLLGRHNEITYGSHQQETTYSVVSTSSRPHSVPAVGYHIRPLRPTGSPPPPQTGPPQPIESLPQPGPLHSRPPRPAQPPPIGPAPQPPPVGPAPQPHRFDKKCCCYVSSIIVIVLILILAVIVIWETSGVSSHRDMSTVLVKGDYVGIHVDTSEYSSLFYSISFAVTKKLEDEVVIIYKLSCNQLQANETAVPIPNVISENYFSNCSEFSPRCPLDEYIYLSYYFFSLERFYDEPHHPDLWYEVSRSGVRIEYADLKQFDPHCTLISTNDHSCLKPVSSLNRDQCYMAHLQGTTIRHAGIPNKDEIVELSIKLNRNNTGLIVYLSSCVILSFLCTFIIFISLFYFIQRMYFL